ncbi:MAG: CoA synthetase [Rhodospirillaceae bacterium]|nr:CoA synthetase [Rhodospirillaceae bacterium]
MSELFTSVEDLANRIPDGAKVALAPDYSGCSMATVRALIARDAKDLHLVGVPSVGFQGDMLIGAGSVATLETAAVTLDEYGPAPRFMAAVKAGVLKVIDGTCPAIHSGLQAAEKGIPFMPVRGILGSDLLEHRDDWITGTDPFSEQEEPLVLVKAIRPDVTLIHAPLADRNGNVWIGVRREMMLMAHAARETLVTAEEIYDGDLLADEARAPGTIPSLYVSALAEAANGAWPVGLFGRYGPDDAHLVDYLERARTDQGFAGYLEEFVYAPQAVK